MFWFSSGTLSPLETTIKELGIEFPVRLENNHVIDANQVWVGVVGTGVTGKRLNSSYNFRSTDEYLVELGNTIVNFARLVPSGLLVFFPSFSILEESIARWQRPTAGDSSASIWDRIVQQKQVYVEPRARLDFKEVVDEYHETIKTNTNGAVFFAVCRGKVCAVYIILEQHQFGFSNAALILFYFCFVPCIGQ
jgi:regulator of telomere elongation helicase 1